MGLGWGGGAAAHLQAREASGEVGDEVRRGALVERVWCGPALDVPSQIGVAQLLLR